MTILLQGRIDIFKENGGDSNLTLNLAKELRRQKVNSYINNAKKVDYSKIDIVHFFGIMRIHDLYSHFLKAKKQNKKIIVTPICEDLGLLDKYGRIGWEGFFSNIASNDLKELGKGFLRAVKDKKQLKSALLQFIVSYSKQQKDLLSSADHIIATSYGEMNDIVKKFAVPKEKLSVIPICINKKNNSINKNLFINKYKLKKFILSVGRIEPKKNQLGLIRALRDVKTPIVFVGELSKYHKSYAKEFLKQVKENYNTRYLGSLDNNMLISAYMCAKVHVLPSWFEILGIASLEAAVNGCNIVTTSNGYAKEYFGDLALYCNPQDNESIRKAVLKAYSAPLNVKLKEKILEECTWDKIVPKILEVYKSVLKK